jgi:hypothetical protein
VVVVMTVVKVVSQPMAASPIRCRWIVRALVPYDRRGHHDDLRRRRRWRGVLVLLIVFGLDDVLLGLAGARR